MSFPQARLTTAGIHRFPSDWEWSFKEHPLPWDGYLLGSVLEGRGEIIEQVPHGAGVRINRGDCYWLPIRKPIHLLRNLGRSSLVLAWMHIEFEEPLTEEPSLCFRPPSFSFWEHLIHRAIEARQRGQKARADAWLAASLVELEGGAASPQVADESGNVYGFRVSELCRKIRMAPGEGWSILRMSREIGLSEAHFTRVFLAQTGRPPHAFVVGVRMEAAQGYLATTAYSVGRIAELLGYSDPFVFSRQFKREIGVSPSQFREQAGSTGLGSPHPQ